MRSSRLLGLLACALAVTLAASCARKPASIQVSPRKVVLYGLERGERLTARVFDKKGQPFDEARPVWSSSSPAVVDVDEGGRVVAKSEGKATVTATSGELSAQVSAEVVDVSVIEVSPPQASLAGPAGTSFLLTALLKSSKDVPLAIPPVWSSSNEKVAKVSPQGLVTSVESGTATVTARLGELQAASEVSVVLRDIARLEMRPATALVRVGDSQRFQVVAWATDGTRMENTMARFQSSNPAVATIDGSGLALGTAAGTATIRAELGGRTAESTLIVN